MSFFQPARAQTVETVVSCCCFKQGSVTLSVDLPRRVFEMGDEITATINVQNDSRTDVKAIKIRLFRSVIVQGKVYETKVSEIRIAQLIPR